jgi:hypothetical protein
MNKITVISLIGFGVVTVVASAGAIILLLYSATCRMCRSW